LNVNAESIKAICGKYGAVFLQNVPIAPYTSFKIGGCCDVVKINGMDVLAELSDYCRVNNIRRYVIGKGSNLLISDSGLDGLVMLMGSDFAQISVDGEVIRCTAGASLFDVCKTAAENSLSGLEFAYGIPGTAGGALYMNAGAYGGEMKDVVISCRYFDGEEIVEADVNELGLSYRHSVFLETERIITEVVFKLEKGDKRGIKAKMEEIMQKRRDKQPLDVPSAGSTFKRPEGYYAAKLIEDCGLTGKTFGGARVSEKHCGFIVNKGGATFTEVTRLIDFVKREVFAATGVNLECEVKIWT